MSDPVEIARVADVDSGVNQPGDEPIMYTGETFRDCAADLMVPEDEHMLDMIQTDLMYGLFWLDSAGDKYHSTDSTVRCTKQLYEAAFRIGIKILMNLDEQGITAKQLGIDEI